MNHKSLRSVGAVASAILVAILICVCVSGCVDPMDKYKPIFKYTDDSGKDIYDWPAADEEGLINVPGGKVPYRLYGKGKTGTPLICLHGGPGGDYGCFYKMLPLAEERPILLFNQLGSSGSIIDDDIDNAEKLKQFYTIDCFMEELNDVVKFSEFKEFALLCSSWGCMLGVEYASNYKPEGLKGIILTGPFLNVDWWLEDANRLILSLDGGEEMLAEVRKCEASDVYSERYNEINTIYGNNFSNRHKDLCLDRPSFDGKINLHKPIFGVDIYKYMWGESEFSCTGILQHHDSTPCLKNIDVPILYMPGQYDEGTPETALKYCALTKKGEVAVIPGAAHGAMSECPAESMTIIREFLNRLQQ